ncbi:MAG: (E)-4-hydroxy-3-methylbut-2-enyl-diphosphate synthase, partial [Verrucomicrobiales bacterium]|nr:(E)-4-hydroxy-3-methylbut-2-enyl-diphosphate synthase [Verrucomicrobiales bacterium]
MQYCPDIYRYVRRPTREVSVRGLGIGGSNPVRVQSMLTSDTRDVDACVREALELAEAGCEIVRVTAQTRVIAENLEGIVGGLRAVGCEVPVVADIHFKPDAAMEAVKWVDKVRVNPGNYADKKKFAVLEYTDEEYAEELARIEEAFSPLVEECKARGVAMRIGTNHGSLSDRIMNRYGDTPLGMVESALEFARIARSRDYHEFMFSMKASNPKVMIEAYRLLVARLAEEGGDWNYPIHLGVTEAGDGEDGRIKSSIGIGSLLMDGIGDTVRVSLTEDAVEEIPVAKALVELCGGAGRSDAGNLEFTGEPAFDPFEYRRRATEVAMAGEVAVGGGEMVRVFTSRPKWDALAHKLDKLGDYRPEAVVEDSDVVMLDPRDSAAVAAVNGGEVARLVSVADGTGMSTVAAFRLLAAQLEERHPILLKDVLLPGVDGEGGFLNHMLVAASAMGSLLCDGIGDAVLVQGEAAPGQSMRLSYNILQ